MKTLIKNAIIGNKTQNILIDCGRIVKITNKDYPADKVVDASGLYAMPGCCNCYFDGDIEDCDNLIQQGVTTVFDFSFNENITTKLISLGLNVYTAIGDSNGNTILNREILLSESKRVERLGAVAPIIFLANPNTCEESQYEEAILFATEHNYLIATSVSEYLEDVGEIDNEYGCSPISLIESYGVLDHKHLLIDCVFADKDDVNLLTNYDANICIRPTTNLKNGSGIAPLYSFLKSNINVVIGGNVRNIYSEVILSKDLQAGYLNEKNAVSLEQIITLTNENAKKIFSDIAILKEGEYADIVFTNNSNIEKITPHNIVHSFVKGVQIL